MFFSFIFLFFFFLFFRPGLPVLSRCLTSFMNEASPGTRVETLGFDRLWNREYYDHGRVRLPLPLTLTDAALGMERKRCGNYL